MNRRTAVISGVVSVLGAGSASATTTVKSGDEIDQFYQASIAWMQFLAEQSGNKYKPPDTIVPVRQFGKKLSHIYLTSYRPEFGLNYADSGPSAYGMGLPLDEYITELSKRYGLKIYKQN